MCYFWTTGYESQQLGNYCITMVGEIKVDGAIISFPSIAISEGLSEFLRHYALLKVVILKTSDYLPK